MAAFGIVSNKLLVKVFFSTELPYSMQAAICYEALGTHVGLTMYEHEI